MRDWYESLAPRERLFVFVCALVVAISLFWALLWAPLDRGHERRAQGLSNLERALTELKALTNAGVAESGTQTSGCINQTPVVIVDRTLRTRSLNLKRSQPAGSGIRVEFENVAFDDLVLWLGDLSAECAMEVQAGSLATAARSGPGRINATLTLERTL